MSEVKNSLIKDKQEKLLNLLKKFKSFAEANDILFFVSSGTCLGAVREGGFIPWDGDIDILLPLKMYEKCEKLMLSLSNSNLKWVSYKSDKRAPNLMGRIYDDNVDFDHFEEYPYLDLFALVGVSQNKKKQKKMMKSSLFNFRVFWIKKRKYSKSLKRKKSKIGLLLKILLFWYPSKMCIRKFERDLNLYDYDSSEEVAPITGLYGQKEVIPKKWFEEEPIYLNFCDTTIPVSKFYKEYLEHMYGSNYMTPIRYDRYNN